jgi:hypothetical protein
MDFELYPTITLRSRSLNALLAPREMFIQALNRNLNLQRFRVLYICGNYSGILSGLDRRFEALEIRRAFTVFQLMTILEENSHTILLIEHDPSLYEDAKEMTEAVSKAIREASKDAAVLLYSSAADPHFEDHEPRQKLLQGPTQERRRVRQPWRHFRDIQTKAQCSRTK